MFDDETTAIFAFQPQLGDLESGDGNNEAQTTSKEMEDGDVNLQATLKELENCDVSHETQTQLSEFDYGDMKYITRTQLKKLEDDVVSHETQTQFTDDDSANLSMKEYSCYVRSLIKLLVGETTLNDWIKKGISNVIFHYSSLCNILGFSINLLSVISLCHCNHYCI